MPVSELTSFRLALQPILSPFKLNLIQNWKLFASLCAIENQIEKENVWTFWCLVYITFSADVNIRIRNDLYMYASHIVVRCVDTFALRCSTNAFSVDILSNNLRL